MKGSALLLLGCLLGATAGSDVLVWDASHPLRSSDFMGEVPPFSVTAASTHYRIRTASTMPDGAHVVHTVTTEFDRQRSWMRPSSMDDPELLGHEQLHFDIAEYHARLLRRALGRPMLYEDIRPRTTFLRDSILRVCATWQVKYDDQTAHGTDGEEQFRWRTVITKYLSSLSAYENPMVTGSIIPSSSAPVPATITEPADSTRAEPRPK